MRFLFIFCLLFLPTFSFAECVTFNLGCKSPAIQYDDVLCSEGVDSITYQTIENATCLEPNQYWTKTVCDCSAEPVDPEYCSNGIGDDTGTLERGKDCGLTCSAECACPEGSEATWKYSVDSTGNWTADYEICAVFQPSDAYGNCWPGFVPSFDPSAINDPSKACIKEVTPYLLPADEASSMEPIESNPWVVSDPETVSETTLSTVDNGDGTTTTTSTTTTTTTSTDGTVTTGSEIVETTYDSNGDVVSKTTTSSGDTDLRSNTDNSDVVSAIETQTNSILEGLTEDLDIDSEISSVDSAFSQAESDYENNTSAAMDGVSSDYGSNSNEYPVSLSIDETVNNFFGNATGQECSEGLTFNVGGRSFVIGCEPFYYTRLMTGWLLAVYTLFTCYNILLKPVRK